MRRASTNKQTNKNLRCGNNMHQQRTPQQHASAAPLRLNLPFHSYLFIHYAPAWLVLWIVFDLDTPISLLLVICLLVLLFAVSVVGCLLGYSSCLVVWIPLFLDPSDGAFGRFDLAALCGCRTLNFCLFMLHVRYIKQASDLSSRRAGSRLLPS